MLLLPLLLTLFPPRYTEAGWLWGLTLVYGAAKLGELFDGAILDAASVGGHALKHLLAATATAFLLPMLRRREPIQSPGASL